LSDLHRFEFASGAKPLFELILRLGNLIEIVKDLEQGSTPGNGKYHGATESRNAAP
jgi:hypothetical protein